MDQYFCGVAVSRLKTAASCVTSFHQFLDLFLKKKHTAKTIKRTWFDGTNERLSQTIVIIFSQLSFLKKNNRPIFS